MSTGTPDTIRLIVLGLGCFEKVGVDARKKRIDVELGVGEL